MDNFWNFLRKHHFRLFDLTFSFAGCVIWSSVLAVWGDTSIRIIYFATKRIISFMWMYHYQYESTFYPKYTVELRLFNKTIFDTGAEASRKTSESVSAWMKEREEKKEAERKRMLDYIGEEAICVNCGEFRIIVKLDEDYLPICNSCGEL